jgi:hypothetical protein
MKKPYIVNYRVLVNSGEQIRTESVEDTQPDEVRFEDEFQKKTATIEQSEPDEIVLLGRETRSVEGTEPDELNFKEEKSDGYDTYTSEQSLPDEYLMNEDDLTQISENTEISDPDEVSFSNDDRIDITKTFEDSQPDEWVHQTWN